MMALRGSSPWDRGETVRKLSPYDVFPPSQRRFRRDRKGSQESYGSVGVMENRRKRVRGQPTPREEERECVRWKEALSLLLCFSSADDVTHSKDIIGGRRAWNELFPFSVIVIRYTFGSISASGLEQLLSPKFTKVQHAFIVIFTVSIIVWN